MKRRQFLENVGAVVAGGGAAASLTHGRSVTDVPVAAARGDPTGVRLAGLTVNELYHRYRRELFEEFLPFWDEHGVDHVRGGFICGLDHDGTRVHTDKFHWFQGRGVWLYSFLYNHFGKDPKHLEIARKTKEFLLEHFPQPDGWWAAVVSREGKVLVPYQGDQFGMYFGAEGLLEYAYATGDLALRDQAINMVQKLYGDLNRPDFRFLGTGDPGVRPQGMWMVNLQIATQYLRRWQDPDVEKIADHCIDVLINRHWNPAIQLNNEVLNFDYSRVKGEENKCVLGHSIEILWMIMDEALRRGDEGLFSTCAERVRRHFEVSWDHVFGGICEAVNVDQGCYEWPVERPAGMTVEFAFKGEYQYMKSMWAMDEALIAMLKVFEHTRAEWAARYFTLIQETIDHKYSLKPHGYPLWLVFADRRFTFQPKTMRKENYHRPRQYVINLLALERMGKG